MPINTLILQMLMHVHKHFQDQYFRTLTHWGKTNKQKELWLFTLAALTEINGTRESTSRKVIQKQELVIEFYF